MRILSADIGNTNTHFGLFNSIHRTRSFLVKTLDIKNNTLYAHLRSLKPDVVCYSCVVPSAGRAFESRLKRRLKCGVLNIVRDFPPIVINKTRKPKTTGQDRLANASYGYYLTKSACCVVDIGSAVNFDVVDGKGRFLGGIIGPGIGLALKAMHANLSLIPNVLGTRPHQKIGTDTPSAVKLGSLLSVTGLVTLGTRRVKEMFNGKVHVIGTGTDAKLFESQFDEIIPDVTLKGIVVSFLASENNLPKEITNT